MTPGSNGTGITYPTIELGGKVYTVKFTRGGFVYRLSKSGNDLKVLLTGKSFAAVVDALFASLYGQYEGTPDELAELVLSENKAGEASEKLREALKKVFPTPAKPDVASDLPESRT